MICDRTNYSQMPLWRVMPAQAGIH